MRRRFGHQRLPGSRRAGKQDTLQRANPELTDFFMPDQKIQRFTQLLLRIVLAADFFKGKLGRAALLTLLIPARIHGQSASQVGNQQQRADHAGSNNHRKNINTDKRHKNQQHRNKSGQNLFPILRHCSTLLSLQEPGVK
ncbi:hypothetical protein D3C81_1762970 [compost metagenome]